MKPLTILLADDHTVVREGLRAFLETVEDFDVVGEATTGREAVNLAWTLRPDVIVMDVAMPKLNGCEATRQILLDNPVAKVLVLSASSDDAYVARLVAAGAMGFLEKQSSGQVLLRAIREVGAGKTSFSPSITRRLLQIGRKAREQGLSSGKLQPALTSREEEVLQLVAEGAPNKQIAAELGISIKTVDKHRQQLMNKLGIHDIAGLTRYAISSGTLHALSRGTGPRPKAAPGVSAESSLAVLAGANRVGYGEFAVRGGRLEARLFLEDLPARKYVKVVQATGAAMDAIATPANTRNSVESGCRLTGRK